VAAVKNERRTTTFGLRLRHFLCFFSIAPTAPYGSAFPVSLGATPVSRPPGLSHTIRHCHSLRLLTPLHADASYGVFAYLRPLILLARLRCRPWGPDSLLRTPAPWARRMSWRCGLGTQVVFLYLATPSSFLPLDLMSWFNDTLLIRSRPAP
jgi:hypothetical protein